MRAMRPAVRKWAATFGASALVFLLAAAFGVYISQRKMLFNNKFITEEQEGKELSLVLGNIDGVTMRDIPASKPLLEYYGSKAWIMRMLGFGRKMTRGPRQESVRVCFLRSQQGRVSSASAATLSEGLKQQPVVLFLHGNTGRVSWGAETWARWVGFSKDTAGASAAINPVPVHFALVSYRGFGYSNFPVDVDPTQASIIDDAEVRVLQLAGSVHLTASLGTQR